MTWSHFKRLSCRDNPFTPQPLKMQTWFLSVKDIYAKNEEVSFLPSLHLTHSVHTPRPWLKVTKYHLRLSQGPTLMGLYERKYILSFLLLALFLLSSKLNSWYKTAGKQVNKILLRIYEVSQPWWKKWILQRLFASLMLRTLKKNTKSKLKYMKLSESVVKRGGGG